MSATRVITSVVLVPILLIIVWLLPYPYFLGLVALATVVGLHEFYRMAEARGARPLSKLGMALGALLDCRNVHVQCASCNCAGSYSPREAERVKIRYTIWMTVMYGQDEVERLIGLKPQQMKMYRTDYYELIEHLKECEKELGG